MIVFLKQHQSNCIIQLIDPLIVCSFSIKNSTVAFMPNLGKVFHSLDILGSVLTEPNHLLSSAQHWNLVSNLIDSFIWHLARARNIGFTLQRKLFFYHSCGFLVPNRFCLIPGYPGNRSGDYSGYYQK